MAEQDTTTPADDETSRFVVAEHPEVGRAVLARTAVPRLGGEWKVVGPSDSPALAPQPSRTPEERQAAREAAAAALAADGGDAPAVEPFDPSEHTVPEVLAHLEGADDDERQRVLTAEQSGKSRMTILDGQES